MRAAGDRGLFVQPLRCAGASARLFTALVDDRAWVAWDWRDWVGGREPRPGVPPLIDCRAAPTHWSGAVDPRRGGGLANDRLCAGARQQCSADILGGGLRGDAFLPPPPLPA